MIIMKIDSCMAKIQPVEQSGCSWRLTAEGKDTTGGATCMIMTIDSCMAKIQPVEQSG